MPAETPAPLEVFLSFAPKDQAMRDALVKHLAQLERDGKIRPWHEGKVGPGEQRKDEIARRLASADIVLLLVSSDFIASNKLYEGDVRLAMERHASGKARVVPVVLRPCDWGTAVFGSLEALPQGGRPVTGYANQDDAFTEIARGLRALVDGLAKQAGGALGPRPRRWKRAVAGAVLVGLAGLSAFLLLRRHETAPPDAHLPSSAPAPTEAPAAPPVPSLVDPGPPASGGPSSAPGALPSGDAHGSASAAGASHAASDTAPAAPPAGDGPPPGQTKVETGDITTGDRSPVSGGNREGGGSTKVTTGKITTGDKSGADIGNVKASPGGAASVGVGVKTRDIKTGNDSPVTIGNTTAK